MNEQLICLKSVDELRVDASRVPLRFYIPAYQRGYRWSPLQVEQLLDDIQEFTKRRNPQPEEFYCLQPLVIKTLPGGEYEVVDGQQRLTTLLLILRHFNERLAERYRQPAYTLAYQTRPSLDSFLNNPTEKAANENVDFFHLYQAIETIEAWFRERDREVETIKAALLNNTKVIWFQLATTDNSVDAFTRLNVGKIPLTNDELIRALFLRSSGPDDRETVSVKLRIAYEWDQVEKAIQSDAFWYFISNQPGKEQNRIGFLFDLFAQSQGMECKKDDAYQVFYTFSERLKVPGATPESEWTNIKQFYHTLEEWFEDRLLYHMIGYLINEGMALNELRALSMGCTKSAFEQRLRQVIYRRAIGEDLPAPPEAQVVREQVADLLNTLTYTNNARKIKSLLLLFNLATLLQNNRSNMRFQFDSFKSERWDIEHIRSITDDRPVRHHERVKWFTHCLKYLESQESVTELCARIEDFLMLSMPEATDEVFDSVYEAVLNHFGEVVGGDTEHGIANLTLLDENTNRSYQNAVFAVKRQQLLNIDHSGIFVPLCTRNVFLKCYSPQVDNMLFWTKADQDGYQDTISTTLTNFFLAKTELSH